jgi:hypothetical protein
VALLAKWDNDFTKPDFVLSKSFHLNLRFFGLVVREEKILKIFPYVNTCEKKNQTKKKDQTKKLCGIVVPPNPWRGMILANMILYYVSEFSCKSELFWFYGS